MAFTHAVFLHNRTYRYGVYGIPLALATNQTADLSYVRIFGCSPYTHVDSALRKKLDDKAWKGVYVGCSPDSPAWLVFNPSTGRIIARRSVVFDEGELLNTFTNAPLLADEMTPLMEPQDTASVLYDRRALLSASTPQEILDISRDYDDMDVVASLTDPAPPDAALSRLMIIHPADSTLPSPTTSSHHEVDDDDHETGQNTMPLSPVAPPPLLRSDRPKRVPLRFQIEDSVLLNTTHDDSSDPYLPTFYPSDYGHSALWTSVLHNEAPSLLHRPTLATILLTDDPPSSLPSSSTIIVPKTMRAALLSPQADRWKSAIKTEYDGIKSRKVFKTVPIPAGQRVLSTKWDFTLKHNKDGSIRKFKARWVVRGFDQRAGLDYDKECLYAPVVSFTSTA
jgi:hypothetical protein